MDTHRTLKFINDVKVKEMELAKDSLSKIIKVSSAFAKKKSKINFPYHLNIIDELRASENAHSRILAKILEYKNDTHYVFLQSFLENLGIDETVSNPTITAEVNRIDTLIRDEKIAIIIENKINGAADQPKQLKNYIDKVESDYNYSASQIFVLYLTKRGGSPSENSLSLEYKEKLDDNYKEINYKNNILPWLEEKVLPECKLKESVLSSAVNQYIDYLKGQFNKREGCETMNAQLKEFLKNELNIKGDLTSEASREELIASFKTLEEVNDCHNHLVEIQEEMRNALRAEFKKKLYEKLNNKSQEWMCVLDLTKEAVDINDNIHHKHFGFTCKEELSLKSETGNTIHLRVLLSAEHNVYYAFVHAKFKEPHNERKFIEKFKKKNIQLSAKGVWIFLPSDAYKDYADIANNLYGDENNEQFINEMDDIVQTFYEQITKVYDAWKQICEESNYQIDLD